MSLSKVEFERDHFDLTESERGVTRGGGFEGAQPQNGIRRNKKKRHSAPTVGDDGYGRRYDGYDRHSSYSGGNSRQYNEHDTTATDKYGYVRY